ncbi:MAG TPA: isoleucine--tRNA ligase [Patescibacteria group bacterium]|nr:isoleucine--tRNA ligase [Patescibacteria group bacterium]
MKFKSGTRQKAIEYEKYWVEKWKKDKVFEQSVELRPKENAFVFYDGPPFITGVPHHGTLLSSIVKDSIPRYQTMKGKRVERVWGWDTHGLPAENFVEKKLGITDRHEIGTKISLADYITTARESMIQTGNLWESTVDRIGRWVDFKGAYKTMDKDYMESVWWAFKTLYEKGKIYEGERVLMYDTKWATPLSKAEVTMDAGAYKVVTDPSVYTKFKLTDRNVYLLAWTTTPWTLPANTALAVNAELDYVEIVLDKQHYIVAEKLADKVFTDEKHQKIDFKILRVFKGRELIGQKYEPLFEDRGKNAHQIWDSDYVTTESGTGIVHIAPAYGEEDFSLAQQKDLPIVHVLDEYGIYTEGEWKGEDVWEINKTIAKTLHQRGDIWKIDYIQHEYPHNLRNGNRLMYRAHPSWFMDIDGQRTEMLEENTKHINWFPDHIKHGRFENTVKTAPDWNLSRDRFWATAMPVWKGIDKDGKEQVKVVGSYMELKELSGVELDDYHRPWVDDITFTIDGVKYSRIDKVLDCWFESGSMPFAQFHYPFENKQKFEENFPGDFIVEYVGQVRAWFYYLHAVNVGLFGRNAFTNVITTGTLLGSDGRKLSKSFGNFTDPNELMDNYSADSFRFLLLASPVLNGEDFVVKDKDVSDIARKLSMIWNMYDFFTLYAEVDKWEWDGDLSDPTPSLENLLDLWIISRLHQLSEQIDKSMLAYDIPNALKPVSVFIEDASNWYVRRSRKRFWKSEDDKDKIDAYKTLHHVLTRLSVILAPFTPFLSEELYTKLTGDKSVHLLDWPEAGHINELLIRDMSLVRNIINDGLSKRATAGIKVRQPLGKATIEGTGDFIQEGELKDIIAEELNVKEVIFKKSLKKNINQQADFSVTIDMNITDELKHEGIMREIIRAVQNGRKEARLQVDDRIILNLSSEDKSIKRAVETYKDLIMHETLAKKLAGDQQALYKKQITINEAPLIFSIGK